MKCDTSFEKRLQCNPKQLFYNVGFTKKNILKNIIVTTIRKQKRFLMLTLLRI